jgi:HD-GYP domain-containing protein (c-di-GMP phosphodiesterase class II)
LALQPLSDFRLRVVIGQPLPFGIRDVAGRLLLAAGQVIHSAEQLEGLLDRGAFVEGSEAQDPVETVAKARVEQLPGLWTASMERMHRALRSQPDGDFHRTLEQASLPVQALLARDPDLAILQVVREEESLSAPYASRHAVHAAIAGQLAAKRLGWDGGAADSLFRAALTMNLSIVELQDQLATQVSLPTPGQRQALRDHPHHSAELLEAAGVRDADWLAAVRTHHEQAGGQGYPRGLSDVGELAQLLLRADAYTAKFGRRATRQPLLSDQAARQFFQTQQGHPYAAAIIKEFGIYPPGSAVRLQSGEVGIVMRRGPSANAPVVAVLLGANGQPLSAPVRRDTIHKAHAVVAALPTKALKVKLRMEELVLSCKD